MYNLLIFCVREGRIGSGLIEYYRTNSEWEYMYSLVDINRMLSAFTTYQMSEENTKGAPMELMYRETSLYLSQLPVDIPPALRSHRQSMRRMR